MPRHPVRHAFTLVELLTVIAIIGILAAILIPLTGRVRASARQTTCLSNLRQLHLGIRLFAQDNKDLLPALYHTKPWYTVLREGYLSDPEVFFCRSAANEPAFSANLIPYGYNLNISGGVGAAPSVKLSALLFPRQLILIADSIDTGNQQYYITRTADTIRAGARHDGKIQLVHADGSVIRATPADLLDDNCWLPRR